MESNKVKVKIHGQEYVIAGEKSREHILKVAGYVDEKMREIERAIKGGTTTALAVLSAVNAADEYFASQEAIADLQAENQQLRKDTEHYVQLWEEVKRSFGKYKEDAQDVTRQKDELGESLSERDKEIERLKGLLSENESNFFDLQMENVQLKSEVERFKKIMV